MLILPLLVLEVGMTTKVKHILPENSYYSFEYCGIRELDDIWEDGMLWAVASFSGELESHQLTVLNGEIFCSKPHFNELPNEFHYLIVKEHKIQMKPTTIEDLFRSGTCWIHYGPDLPIEQVTSFALPNGGGIYFDGKYWELQKLGEFCFHKWSSSPLTSWDDAECFVPK